ncbi:MAG: hypothetical protein R2762_27960 [Bryobacteraceae bacterium]
MKQIPIGIAVVFLSSLAAAQPLSCVGQVAGTPPVRSTGITEKAGDILVICNGGIPTPAGNPVPTVDLTVSLAPAVNITARTWLGNASEALLLVDEPQPAHQVACPAASTCALHGVAGGIQYGVPSSPGNGGQHVRNVYQANAPSGSSITIAGVPFDPPGPTAVRFLRIANLFFNAAQLNVPAGSGVPVVATLSSTGGVNLNIQTFFPLTVAAAIPPLDTALLDGAGVPSSLITLSNRSGNNVPLANSPFAAAAPDGVTFHARAQERFPAVLRVRNGNNWPSPDSEPPLMPQSDTGALYSSETGFYNPSFPLLGGLRTAGLASRGTRLVVRFSGVPSGVKLYVPVRTVGSAGKPSMRLVLSPPNGNTGSLFLPAPAASPVGGGIVPLIGCPTTCYAVYEVTTADSTAIESADVPVYLAYRPNSPLGTISFDVSLGSTSGQATAVGQGLPRFAPSPGPPVPAVRIQ